MIEVSGNLFDVPDRPEFAICIPTNGNVKKGDVAVMGAGVAKVARDKYPGCDAALGIRLASRGHKVQQFWIEPNLISFPTKNNWKDESNIEIVRKSCNELVAWSLKHVEIKQFYLPKVGSGLGGLNYEQEVKPILEEILTDDKFIVIIND